MGRKQLDKSTFPENPNEQKSEPREQNMLFTSDFLKTSVLAWSNRNIGEQKMQKNVR